MAFSKIFFFHNPKAAGTAVSDRLRQHFPEDQFCPKIENDALQHDALNGDYSAFKGFAVYDGHYGLDIYRAVCDGHAAITNFRHPFARVASLYNYFRFSVSIPEELLNTEQFFAVRAAKTLGFSEFVASNDERINLYIENQHFRQLTGSCWSNAIDGEVSDACALIDAMPWYYVTEYPGLSERWAHRVLGWNASSFSVLNATSGPKSHFVTAASISVGDYDTLRKKNAEDLFIYNYAVEKFLRRAIEYDT